MKRLAGLLSVLVPGVAHADASPFGGPAGIVISLILLAGVGLVVWFVVWLIRRKP